MKITKQRIKEIIKEEMELASSVSSKMDLKKEMEKFSKALPDDQVEIAPNEAKEVYAMIRRALAAAASTEKDITADLKKANNDAEKYLNVDTITEDQLEEITKDTARGVLGRKLRKLATDEEKIEYAKRYMAALNSKDPEKIKEFHPKIFRGKSNEEAKEIANRAAENIKNYTPKVLQKIEKDIEANNEKAAVDTLVAAAEEAKVTGEPDAEAEEEGESPTEQEVEIKPLLDKFFKLLTRTNLLGPPKNLNESLRSLLDALGAENMKVVGSSLRDNFKPRELKALGTYFKNKENVLTFVKQYFANNPEYEQIIQKLTAQPADEPAAEEPKTDAKGTVELPSGDKAIPSQFDDLVDVFKRFSDDDKGFMMKTYLAEQDKLLGELRSALRRFIGLEGQEAALAEQEEPQPQAQPEDKSKGSRESLVKYVSRYRRDINNTSKVMGEYLAAAQAGTYKAQPILNKLKIQLQRLQDDNALIVRDLKALAGLKESLLLEEESREEKIAKVRKAYDEIVNLLRPLLNVDTVAPEEENKTEEPPAEESAQEEQNEELVLEDIYLEQVSPSEQEMQSYVNAVKDALTAIDSIKGYFRLTGTFNRPLEEVKNDFVKYIQDYKNTMSDLVSDLKSGIPGPDKAKQYVEDFARLAKQIQDDFGVSPKEPIKTPEVTVSPEGAKDDAPAIADNPEAQQAAEAEPQERPTDAIMPDEAPGLTREVIKDEVDFISKNPKIIQFLRNMYNSFEDEEEIDFVFLKQAQDLIPKLMLKEQITYQEMFLNFLSLISNKNLSWFEKNAKLVRRLTKKLHNFYKIIDSVIVKANKEAEEIFKDLSLEAELERLKTTKDEIDKYLKSLKKGKKSKQFVKQDAVRGIEKQSVEESNNLLEKLIRQELKVLNGKKMVRN